MAIYHYRDRLTSRELLPALGAGAVAGLAVAYLTQIVLRKRDMVTGRPEEIVIEVPVSPPGVR